MTKSALTSASDVTVAARDLVHLQRQIDKARGVLRDLQCDVEAAGSQLDAKAAAQLLEANEQLTLAALRAQWEAESAVQESAFRELTVERRLKAQSLSEEKRQIQETGRLKSQFFANMLHELRTPLTAVIGLASCWSRARFRRDPRNSWNFWATSLPAGGNCWICSMRCWALPRSKPVSWTQTLNWRTSHRPSRRSFKSTVARSAGIA